MKKRSGFVSNSSSTSFILDMRDKEVASWVKGHQNSIPRPWGGGRLTCLALGTDALDYARELWDPDWQNELGEWIFEWARKIGTENLVFARESDEGMGGYLGEEFPAAHAVAEMEYH